MFFDRRPVSGLLWLVKWAVAVLLATLIADCLYVMWPYPGDARGVASFEAIVEHEWRSTIGMAGDRLPEIAYAIHDRLYVAFFRWTGLDYLLHGAIDAGVSQRPDALMARLVQASDTFLRTAATGLQLFSLKLGVLALSAPFVGLVTVGAAADGFVTWYWRRTGGGRESGFVFHSAKRLGAHALLAFCFIYLVPPQAVDPRIAVTALVVAVALAVRISVANFKKYL